MLSNEDKTRGKYERKYSSWLYIPALFESLWKVGVPLLRGKIFLTRAIMLSDNTLQQLLVVNSVGNATHLHFKETIFFFCVMQIIQKKGEE